MKRTPTRYTGVYERKAEKRVHNGRPDVCFDITYKRFGKKIWEKVGWLSEGYSAKVASDLRANRLRNVRHGDELPQDKVKAPYFKDIASKYLEWAAENKSRGGCDDASRYGRYLSPTFDDKRLDEIFPLDLERLKNQIARDGLSPASVKHTLVLFRQMFNKAVLWGLYKGENPIKGVKMPVLQNQRERFLTPEEADKLLIELKSASGQLLHDMALLSLHCGLRFGEICNIRGQDLDFENGMIHIADPKNKQSRKAFMSNTVKKMLAMRKPDSPDELLFRDRRHGGRVNYVSATFGRAIKKLGLNDGITDPRQKITFHSLRHTFASWLALNGEPILTIRDLLGHKTLAMTSRYAHLMPEHKKQAVLNLEKFLKKKKGESHAGKR
ncbi:MAG: site-specific integrase [Syntrophaceae bacterium]|nr:site-specific integrase [Syntrophaceae bacterium]